MNTLAVLLTCHNRRDQTIECLDALHRCLIPPNFQLEIFLVDDGSTDGTAEAVGKKFPSVNIIHGSGNLFWNQGMRLAWETAAKRRDYDFYLWLNDDTIPDADGVAEIINTYQEALTSEGISAVICGACRADEKNDVFTYGGRTDNGAVIPNGQLQKIKYMNGNIVLVPKSIFKKIGNLSPEYTHSLGDIDYGLMVKRANMNCFTTRKYVATCPPHDEEAIWSNPEKPFTIRWKYLHSPKGLNIKEYIIFRRKFHGLSWISFAMKAYLKVLSPDLYRKFSSLK